MVFSSVTFLFFFLPVFLTGYLLMPGVAAKNAFALAFSLIFYAWGEPWAVPVLLASIAVNGGAAILIDGAEGTARRRNLALAVAANLLLLATFKYADFIIANISVIAAYFGFQPLRPLQIPLPLGISFFTFHGLSYIIDVYRRRVAANRDLVQVALYISLFPQLIAGPIVRYKTMDKRLRARRFRALYAAAGAKIFVIGLAQKVLIADEIAPLAIAVFDNSWRPSLAESWIGLIAYSIQLYFDFAGYSNMAIGLALVLGFRFPRNFRLPYSALSVTEFWRRWHMSLSAWLRDYLYIPLGGNRGGAAATYRNLAVVFLLCGLWHGASWTFVLWGAWHGYLLIIERVGFGRILAATPIACRWAYTLLVVMLGWCLFRAHDLHHAIDMLRSLAGMRELWSMRFDVRLPLDNAAVPLAIGAILAVLPRWVRLPRLPGPVAAVADAVYVLGLLSLAMLSIAGGTYSPFLYFRF